MKENFILKEEHDLKQIWARIKKRDFSGNSGLAIKNSIYQFSTQLSAKIGALLFTIIMARLLLPELFGLYSLALSTILLFSTISNLGIGETLITFVSNSIGHKNFGKAKTYLFYLGKIKLVFILISISLLLLSARYISESYYQKPLFLALVFGSFYVLSIGTLNFLESFLQSLNYFRGLFYKEIIFQLLRLLLVPLVTFISLKKALGNEQILTYIILTLSIAYLITALFVFAFSRKKYLANKLKKVKLNKKESKQINKFLLITATFILSGLFFSLIDRIMLGHFVSGEFIGYYTAAFNLVGSLSALVGFGAVLLPIFGRMHGKNLKRIMDKSTALVFLFGFGLFILTLVVAPLAIKIIYGPEYNAATNLLRLLGLLLFPLPLIGIYAAYFLSLKKPEVIAKWVFASTLINILLNYLLISTFLNYSEFAAVFGAGIATIASQFFYLSGLVFSKNKEKND